MTVFSKHMDTKKAPIKRKRVQKNDAALTELATLKVQLERMKKIVRKVSKRGRFNASTFLGGKAKRKSSPEALRKMWDLVRGPTLRKFDPELAKPTTILFSKDVIIDLTDGTERLGTYATLNKPLFYEWCEPVVEEIVGLFPRLENRIPEIYAACMQVVRNRRRNQNARRKNKKPLHNLRFQTPPRQQSPPFHLQDSGEDADPPFSPEEDSQAAAEEASYNSYSTPPRHPKPKNDYSHRLVRLACLFTHF